jgi:hypothetical protein
LRFDQFGAIHAATQYFVCFGRLPQGLPFGANNPAVAGAHWHKNVTHKSGIAFTFAPGTVDAATAFMFNRIGPRPLLGGNAAIREKTPWIFKVS